MRALKLPLAAWAVIAAILLAGCGEEDEPAEPTTTEAAVTTTADETTSEAEAAADDDAGDEEESSEDVAGQDDGSSGTGDIDEDATGDGAGESEGEPGEDDGETAGETSGAASPKAAEEAIDRFIEAVAAYDAAGVCSMLTSKALEELEEAGSCEEILEPAFEAASGGATLLPEIEIIGSEVDGDKAVVTIDADGVEQEIPLSFEDGEWKLESTSAL